MMLVASKKVGDDLIINAKIHGAKIDENAFNYENSNAKADFSTVDKHKNHLKQLEKMRVKNG